MFDAIVIGGGAIGLSVAWRLLQAGLETAVVERARVGRGASWAAAGMLCPVSEASFTERALLDLGLDSMRRYPEFIAELEGRTGLRADYEPSGALAVALDNDEARELRRLLEFQQALGLDAQWLGRDACQEREPMLSHRVVGGVFAPQDHRIDNRALVEALHRAVTLEGGRVMEQTSVQGLVRDGDAIRGVRTPGALLQTRNVIVAGGAWSSALSGLGDGDLPAIRPIKGQALALRMDPSAPLTRLTIRGRRAYLVPRRDGRLVVGATSEERGFDYELTAGGQYDLLRGAYELLPGTYELGFIEAWAGLRPCSRDNLPIIGPGPARGLFFATGHYRGGILYTPTTAWAIAAMVRGGGVPEVVRPLSFERFRS